MSSIPSSTTTRRSRSSGSSSSTCCGSTSRRRRGGLARAVGELHDAGRRLDARRLDSLRFEGPGTDLTVGLLPTSRFAGDAPGSTTVDGVVFNPNLPTEEVFTTPDPTRTDGVVTATKPLDVDGTRRPRPARALRGWARGARSTRTRTPRRCAPAWRRTTARLAARRGRARRPRRAHRQDGHRLLQHAARRERRQPSRARQRLRDRRSARRTATASTRARSTSTS